MDLEEVYGITVEQSICVIGLTKTDTDAGITASLATYGTVAKVVRLPAAVKQNAAIVEFDADIQMANVELNLPFEIPNVNNPAVTWQADSVNALAHTTSQTALSSSSESSDESIHSEHSTTPLICRSKTKKTDLSKLTSPPLNTKPDKEVVNRYCTRRQRPRELGNYELNPTDVQRIVVEHVIKNDAFTSQSSSKWLRPFSGRVPKPPGEVDFETLCLHVDLMFQDGAHVDVQRRKILESLLPPASNVVRQLGSSAHPREYVKLLDSAYGLVEDGDEIFARFLNTHQNSGEKASEYLQRLQVLLSTAVKRDGVSQSSASQNLLKQFKRGCWDHTFIMQLELKPEKHLDFAELLLQLRTEEDRRATKFDRMHRHFGASKPKVTANVHSVPNLHPYDDPNGSVLQAYIAETESLKKQVAELKLQLSTKAPKKRQKNEAISTDKPNLPTPRAEAQAHQVTHKPQPRAWFCFRCGHIARVCENPINKDAVDRKYKELKAKQDKWRAKQDLPLNWTGSQ
ncbi:Paraneoplastic antigen Ma1 [Merluccius polli]|uniref:Paraneoplastic antigen Ma1 n=1 Tax=Merluccius polli TaxID=89951 RepID=A0AA47NCG9_MERPO|nr:Paraneoplastic antigen Ma1 [Merluccius polli]